LEDGTAIAARLHPEHIRGRGAIFVKCFVPVSSLEPEFFLHLFIGSGTISLNRGYDLDPCSDASAGMHIYYIDSRGNSTRTLLGNGNGAAS
jgi:hypothetical protein